MDNQKVISSSSEVPSLLAEQPERNYNVVAVVEILIHKELSQPKSTKQTFSL